MCNNLGISGLLTQWSTSLIMLTNRGKLSRKRDTCRGRNKGNSPEAKVHRRIRIPVGKVLTVLFTSNPSLPYPPSLPRFLTDQDDSPHHDSLAKVPAPHRCIHVVHPQIAPKCRAVFMHRCRPCRILNHAPHRQVGNAASIPSTPYSS